MLFNFTMGRQLSRCHMRGAIHTSKVYLTLGVAANLGLLGYFKYANFFIDNLNLVSGTSIQLEAIVLPLAISFFTFQQIAYLVDSYKGITKEYQFTHYALFVTFFPQLIAGPIVHYGEMLPQFMKEGGLRVKAENIAVGITIFSIGLFKKVVLADGVAVYASPVYDAAAQGDPITFFIAWGGALAYTMQLYFDFSGYSDMAIGAARLFGIKLPLNFHSPYKATSIVEFWRRWHMTLSRFLRDYVYIPLGGNKKGQVRRYTNLMTTMLLGGLWHGAGWTFVAWGGLHGCYLAINHGWHHLRKYIGLSDENPGFVRKGIGWTLTFVAVVVGWVFFRAEDFASAVEILRGMSGFNGIAIPYAIAVHLGELKTVLEGYGVEFYLGGGTQFVSTYLWITALMIIALVMPNTQELMADFAPAFEIYPQNNRYAISVSDRLLAIVKWSATPTWAMVIALVTAMGLLSLSQVSEFLYFQF